MKNKVIKVIETHFADIQYDYPELVLHTNRNVYEISGNFEFHAGHEGLEDIEDTYLIRITFEDDFPDSPPTAFEYGGKIPTEFHKYSDNSLCLGSRFSVGRTWHQEPTLRGFINRLLIPYLYNYSHLVKYKKLPFGELEHGGEGLFNDYIDYFSVDNAEAVLGFLKILCDDNYRGHSKCPCGSGVRLRKCHGIKVLTARNNLSTVDYLREYDDVATYLIKGRGMTFHRDLLPRVFKHGM